MPPRRKSVESPKRKSRPQAPPPALMDGQEGVEGSAILEEVAGASAVLLWQSLRDATLWARAPEPREGLFAPGRERARVEEIVRCQVDAPLIGPLTTLSRVLGSATPPEPKEVAGACRALSVWADGEGLLRTALAFAQAAAVVCPGDAMAAYRVGWLARRRAEYARAETWFRRAVGLARRSQDRNAYALAHIGIGNMHMELGNLVAAREALLRALRTARRASFRKGKAMALHDLFIVLGFTGDVVGANRYASQAFRAYGPQHARLPVIAHDIAWLWTRQGYYERALPVFKAILQQTWQPSEKILAIANCGRAAGGAGDLLTFVGAWSEVWYFVDGKQKSEHLPEALLHLTYGAAYLGDVERTEMAAQYAIVAARERGESRVAEEAEEILSTLRAAGRLGVTEPPSIPEGEMGAADTLAADLVHALEVGTAAG